MSVEGQGAGMESVQKALRNGDVEKDNFGRLTCNHCGERLKTENDPDRLHSRKVCPECGRKWKQLH